MLKPCKVCADYRSPAAVFQDEKYGKGIRVHNERGAKNRGKCRCTVCNDEKAV